jgi:aspartyl-tRNA(Asn)/glutamyl-tRNA(Gln) amidotransferase subunit A
MANGGNFEFRGAVGVGDLSIRQARERIAAGELSPVALVQTALDRIAAVDGELNVFRTVVAERALAEAGLVDDAARRGDPLGPLAGIPVALKDNIEVAGVPMTAGTRFYDGGVPERDAPVWERMRGAGAVLVGKLSMAEWAIGGTGHNVHFGPCRNPWDPERVTGGSSSGSAAALAAGMVMAALGTDTAGSVRIPAALCGVSGLRPSAGRVSNRGSVPVAWSFDAIGPMARRAEDVAQVLSVIAGYDPEDACSVDTPAEDYVAASARGASGLRVGVLSGDWLADADAAVVSAVRDAAATLARSGAEVDEVDEVELPGRAEAFALTAEMVLAEAAWVHRERLAQTPEVFAPDVLERLRRGTAVTGPRYAWNRQWQRVWRRRVLEALERRDLLLAPASPIPAPAIADSDPLEMTARLTPTISPWVLCGTPVMALPAGFCDGLPIGVQLVGKPFAEAIVLAAARAFQQATDWHLQRPPHVSAAA